MDGVFSIPDSVLAAYELEGSTTELLTGGRTNRTIRIQGSQDLVLQQMNATLHDDVLGVMENLVRVTSHLRWRDMQRSMEYGDSIGGWYPELTLTAQGKPFLINEAGDVWRAFLYRPGRILRSKQPDAVLQGAASLYGRFSAAVVDIDSPELLDTTPGFHDLDRVSDAFLKAFESAPTERRALLEPHIDRLKAVHDGVERRSAADGLGDVRHRVVHNDTKLSNVLFDVGTDDAIAVLDLDLVMMGPCWHDVGDLVRSAAWHAHDDGIPRCAPELFGGVVGAFVTGAAGSLAADEVATFAAGAPRIAFELGVRYLHDHLRDEPHLRVEGQNGHFHRGLANVKLAEEMLGAYDALRPMVDEFSVE